MADTPVGRTAPRDLQAETALLGCCILQGDMVDLVLDVLVPDEFYSDANGRIWAALVAMSSAGTGIDTTLLRARLQDTGELAKVGGDDYLLGLTSEIPTVFHVERYAKRIREMAAVRRMIVACHRVASMGYGPVEDVEAYLDLAEFDVLRAAERVQISTAQPLSATVGAVVQQVVDRPPGRLLGLTTGIKALDDITTGWSPGQLIIIAGRPGMGKSAFAENNARRVAQEMDPVLWFSLEMPADQLIGRMLSGNARVDAHKLRTGTMYDQERGLIREAGEGLKKLPIYIDDTPGVNILTVKRQARRLKRKHGLALVVVDYLQLMGAVDTKLPREQQIADTSKGLKMLAMELGIPVVALAQLNRDLEKRPRGDRRPQLSDLRDSGSLEQDADTVVFIYRDEVYNQASADEGIAELIVGKQRSGPVGVVKSAFVKRYARFEDLDEQQTMQEEGY